MMKVLFLGMVITTVWVICLEVVKRLDAPKWMVKRKEYIRWMGISVVNTLLIANRMERLDLAIKWSVLAGCLIFACITDCKCCQVYQFVWWMGGICGVFCLPENMENLPELVLFGILQEFFFCRFYGRADSHAFVVCALMQSGMGMGLREYLIHMLLAFGGLGMVQLFRKNINGKGNLKKPVAFLPYITISFWLNCYCFYQ